MYEKDCWDPERKSFVTEKLKIYWSPEQIAGRLKVTGSALGVSYSAIYRAIHAGQLDVSKKCLRRKGRKASPHDEEAASMDTRPSTTGPE